MRKMSPRDSSENVDQHLGFDRMRRDLILVASGAMGFDLINYYRYYEELKDLSLLFGVQLQEVVQVFDQFIDVQVTPMIGLYLTAAGLLLLKRPG